VLSSALSRLRIIQDHRVWIGLGYPDDAAVVQLGGDGSVAATVDFFSPFVDDPFLVGRVAAINAANDLFAIGSRPEAALAVAAVEPGPQPQQEQYLFELLAGAVGEFDKMGTSLVGGHSIESPQPLIGFSLFAAAGVPPRVKGGLRPGEYLVLTKPLGSGILLAAHMRAQCQAEWFEELERILLTSNQSAAKCAQELDIQGITDVTGFGLAGHLLEMSRASGVSVELWLDHIPMLPGVRALLAGGIESSLAPANRSVESEIEVTADNRTSAEYAVLFDPQTCGGLLLGVPAEHLQLCLRRLHEDGNRGVVIGRVVDKSASYGMRVVRQEQHLDASPDVNRAPAESEGIPSVD
jgi:selenide,water dikinase